MDAWLTPDAAPTATKDIKLTVPVHEALEGTIRGALAPLCDSANWEQHGALTPEETADIFNSAAVTVDGMGNVLTKDIMTVLVEVIGVLLLVIFSQVVILRMVYKSFDGLIDMAIQKMRGEENDGRRE